MWGLGSRACNCRRPCTPLMARTEPTMARRKKQERQASTRTRSQLQRWSMRLGQGQTDSGQSLVLESTLKRVSWQESMCHHC